MIPVTPDQALAIAKLVMGAAAAVGGPASSGQALGGVDNLADASNAILKCYHHTATYREARIVQHPWNRQGEFGAAGSALVRIDYAGVTGAKHVMLAALMVRKDAVRAHVVDDKNRIGWDRRCGLTQWVPVAAPAPPR